MDNGNVKIHKYLNAKMTFGNWEIDVFMIMASGAGLSMVIATNFIQMVILIVGSAWLAMKYAKLKEDNVRGIFEHILYYYGLKKYPDLPESHVKQYFG